MLFEDLVRLIEPRARRLGIPQDGLELLGLAHGVLQSMADRFDFDAFTDYSTVLAQTSAGIDRYALPERFGRLLHPTDDQQSNLVLWDGTNEGDLTYRQPIDFHHQRATTTGRPSTYTVMNRVLWLTPIPDDNDGANYTVRGPFIMSLRYPEMDDPIPLDEPGALVDAVLAAAALDAGVPQAAEFARREQASQSVAANGQAKLRQTFHRSRPARRL